jgi:hypothetical protein
MDLCVGSALRTQSWGGGDQCRDEKKRRDSFQEHLLNRRLRPDSYFTASRMIFLACRWFEKAEDRRL